MVKRIQSFTDGIITCNYMFISTKGQATMGLYNTIFKLGLVLLFTGRSSPVLGGALPPESKARSPGDGDCGGSYLSGVFKYLNEHPTLLRDLAREFLATKVSEEGELEEILEELIQDEPTEGVNDADEPGCSTCKNLIRTINLSLRLGASWPEIRALAMPVCNDLQSSQGYNAEAVCSPIVDSFGPHAYYILSQQNFAPQYVCETWNECYRPEVYDPVSGSAGGKVPKELEKEAEKELSEEERKVRRENAIRVVHFTDIHVDERYMEGSIQDCDMPVCCHEGYGPLTNFSYEEAGYWGEYNCNAPPRTTELLLSKVAEFQPHLVLNTGDNPDHHLWEISQEITLDVNSWVARAIATNIPNVPAYATLGNHETYPTNLYYTQRPEVQEINAGFYTDYELLSNFGPEQEQTILSGGYYSVEAFPGLRIISYNSNFGASDNWYYFLYSDDQDYAAHDLFLQTELALAAFRGEKVILLGHHMQGSGGGIVEDGQFKNQLLSQYGDTIILHLGGHNHVDEFRLVFDPVTKEPRSTMFLGVTLNTRTEVNPGFRIYYLDPETLTPFDYDQYHIDLPLADGPEEPEISLFYRASSEYGIPDLTANSYYNLFQRFDEDHDLFLTYYNNRRLGARGVRSCDETCKYNTKCGIASTDYTTNRRCVLGIETPFP